MRQFKVNKPDISSSICAYYSDEEQEIKKVSLISPTALLNLSESMFRLMFEEDGNKFCNEAYEWFSQNSEGDFEIDFEG